MVRSRRGSPDLAAGVGSLAPLAVLTLATLAVYAPVLQFGFVNFDDPGYVSANPHLRGGLDRDGVVWAFTTGRTANWIPLTWLSYLLDVSLFGASPAGHHAVNVLLHVANVLLVFGVLRRLGARPGTSFVVAAVFALHPLRVESVAWISERKDVLCAFFGLSTVLSWVWWTERGGAARYVATLLLFALGLMAKPMLVTLPCVLLLLDYWPLRRSTLSPGPPDAADRRRSTGRLLLEKAPFFALAAASSVITVLVQHAAGAVADRVELPAGARVAGVLAAYAWYVQKTLWPSGLAALYPNPALLGGTIPGGQVATGAALLAGVGLLALREARRRPWLLVGWACFVGMLVPVVGLVQVGQQSTADRYSYLPSIGLLVVLVAAMAEAARALRVPRALRAACVLTVLVALALATRAQLPYWRDSVALASRALAVTEGNYVMHFNLAQALDERGDVRGAARHYAEAVRLRPDLAIFRVNLGVALARTGRPQEAVAQYRTAMALDPHELAAPNNLAWLLATHPAASQRDGAQALELAREVARLRPGDPDALDLLATALAETGRFLDAERTAASAIVTARDAGRAELVPAIEARRALYAARRPYREDPIATGAPLTARSPEPRDGAPPRPTPSPATGP